MKIYKIACLLLALVVVTGISMPTDVSAINEEAIYVEETVYAEDVNDDWLKLFVVSQDEWLKDHNLDPDLLILEEGYEVIIDTWVCKENSNISIMKRPITNEIMWVPNCCSNPKISGNTEWNYYHNSAPHPTICVYRTSYYWRCSYCGSSGIHITDTPRNCPSSSYYPD